MRRRVSLVMLGVLAAGLGLASARASGAGAPAATTTTGTTTTATTATTATMPSYSPLAPSSLPTGCVGAGIAAVVPPGHSVIAFGTPATDLGPSGYPASASVVAFGSSTAGGSTCSSANVTLTAVSLFDGAVTATTVAARDGRGVVSGLAVDGTPVTATAGQTVPVEGWGELTLDEAFGRLRTPLLVTLLRAHDGLLAGTRIALAFAATPEPRPVPQRGTAPPGRSRQGATSGAGHAARTDSGKKRRQAPGFPTSAGPFLTGDSLPRSARDNPVVAVALRYLGVPYQWGGANPSTGFDCSGLVMYVFARLGVSLPHYAAAQYDSPDTVWVKPSRLRPGDLVFFTGSDGTRQAPGHVGIYVGDGYLIDAPHTGSFVQVDSLGERWFANKFVGARRVVATLLDSRRAARSEAPSEPSVPGFLSRFPIQPAGETLGAASAAVSAARAASHADWIWVDLALGGLALVLLGSGLCVRRVRVRISPLP